MKGKQDIGLSCLAPSGRWGIGSLPASLTSQGSFRQLKKQRREQVGVVERAQALSQVDLLSPGFGLATCGPLLQQLAPSELLYRSNGCMNAWHGAWQW